MEGMETALGSESAAEEMVGPRLWEVPTEEVVQELMETFLDPLLPSRVSNTTPSEVIQIAVARQMHTVVLLYNYHHRKQKSELVFLEFVKFCQLATAIRPPMIAFMKLVKGMSVQELNGTEDQLSVTEKAIKDACNIAIGLDASRDVPKMVRWPISKVAVLLVDSKKENCVLQSDAVIEGAHSLIEKELGDSSGITLEISGRGKVGNKRKRGNQKAQTYNTEFLQLGYDVVKDVTGIRNSDLKVLESHTTYSLSKEKSAACFYIMQSSGSFDEHDQVSLKFLADSVQGPLAEKLADGSFKTTPLARFYRMLPYVELILSWFSRCQTDISFSDKKASPADIPQRTRRNLRSNSVKRFDILDSAASNKKGILEKLANVSEQADKCLLSGPSRGPSEMVMEVENSMEVFEKECDMADAESNEPVSGQSEGFLQKTVADDSTEDKVDEKHDARHSAEKNERRICPKNLDEVGDGCRTDIFSCPPRMSETTNVNDLTDICASTTNAKKPNAEVKVYHHRRKKNNVTQLNEDVPGLKVGMMDALESNQTQLKDEKVSGDEGCLLNTCHQTGTVSIGDQQVQLETETKQNTEVQSAEDSLMLNYTKRKDENISRDEGYLCNSCECMSEDEGYFTNSCESVSGDEDSLTNSCENVSEDEGSLTNSCNHSGSASKENLQDPLEAEIKQNVEVQCKLDSFDSHHIQSRHLKVSGDDGYLTNSSNQNGTASTENLQAQPEAETKQNVEELKSMDSSSSDHIQSQDKTLSGDKGDHTQECNHTGIAFTATGNQLAQVEAKSKHYFEDITISGPDQLQNALTLLYRKRRDVYSQICNMEDALALCEDNVARIRDGGEVDLARKCIESVISGNFHLLLENGTQVQDKCNHRDGNRKSEHMKPTLSEAYLVGKSSCQDLEYTCQMNNWRLPRYLTISSNGKFQSKVVVEGKDFKLHAQGGLKSHPSEARETAAAQMITVMHSTFS